MKYAVVQWFKTFEFAVYGSKCSCANSCVSRLETKNNDPDILQFSNVSEPNEQYEVSAN